MGYYDDWDEGREFVDIPSEAQIIDWNIHNDHQDGNEDTELPECDTCGNPFTPNWDDYDCDSCMTKYWKKNPHPLDIAEREELEDRSAGLEEPWWAYR